MKIIEINKEHYLVVDDSEIKEGEFVYDTITNTIWTWEKYTEDEIDSKYNGKVFKITHSTQPLNCNCSNRGYRLDTNCAERNHCFDKVQYLSLQEVKN